MWQYRFSDQDETLWQNRSQWMLNPLCRNFENDGRFQNGRRSKWPPKIKVCRIVQKMGYLGKSGTLIMNLKTKFLSDFRFSGKWRPKLSNGGHFVRRLTGKPLNRSKPNLPHKWTSLWWSVIMFRIFQDGRYFQNGRRKKFKKIEKNSKKFLQASQLIGITK